MKIRNKFVHSTTTSTAEDVIVGRSRAIVVVLHEEEIDA
jgi:hypothetical protein